MGELVARGQGLHAHFRKKVLIVVGTGAAHEKHGGLAFGARTHIVHDGLDLGHLLGDDILHAGNELGITEVLGDLAQGLGRGLGADEVHLDPRDAVLGLEHVGHVVDGTVAHDRRQVGLVGRGELVVGGVAREGGDVGDAALGQDAVDLETVAADVVLAQQVDLELAFEGLVLFADHVGEDLVVGDVVAGRLADTLVALAAEGEDIAVPELVLHLAGHGVNVVADEPHGAGGEDGDGLGMEDIVGFLNGRLQLLLTAEDDVLVLHVRREAVGHEVFGALGRGVGLVPAGQPGIEAAADGAVGNVDDVAGGPQDDALAAGIGAAAHGDDARNGPDVGRYFRRLVAEGLVDEDLGGAFSGDLGRILGEHVRLDIRGRPVDELLGCR